MAGNRDILILGAGPAGMAAAMELSKAGKTATIVELDSRVGGLAQTLVFREGNLTFRTDIGPHRFFSKNPYLYSFIQDLLHERWMLVPRKTRQYIDGKFYDYPIKAGQAFRNIGLWRASKMLFDYAGALWTYRVRKQPIRSFEDYIVANFGRSLGEFNMLNYTEKIWGVPCSTLHADWARQRIKGLNLVTAAKNALSIGKKHGGPKTLVDEFYYPQFGSGLIYETIAKRIEDKGSDILLQSKPTAIHHEKNKGGKETVTAVELDVEGKRKLTSPKWVATSIPITELLTLLRPLPPKAVQDAAANLRWRSQVYLFVTLDKPRVTDDNWIYFPNKNIPFGRIAEMKNFSADMSPKDKTSLFIEFFVDYGDKLWNASKEQLLELTLPHAERIGLFTRSEVRSAYLIRRRYVYPVYDLRYQSHLAVLQQYLDAFSNLVTIGRPGRFKYNNQDHSLEMGILAARTIIEGKRYDVEAVGAEKEYFEHGAIQDGSAPRRNAAGQTRQARANGTAR